MTEAREKISTERAAIQKIGLTEFARIRLHMLDIMSSVTGDYTLASVSYVLCDGSSLEFVRQGDDGIPVY